MLGVIILRNGIVRIIFYQNHKKISIIISIYFWNLSNPQNGKSLLIYQCQILSAVIVSADQQSQILFVHPKNFKIENITVQSVIHFKYI